MLQTQPRKTGKTNEYLTGEVGEASKCHFFHFQNRKSILWAKIAWGKE